MINYELKYSVSEVAKILDIDKKLIKDISYHFSEYLNPKANPEKGKEREFTVEDICTLGYIYMYWEDDPDIENIEYGLNSNDQFEQPYSELATQATPIFRDFSEELIGGKVWVIGGTAEYSDILTLAESYKKAADLLVDTGIKDDTNREIIYPAIYNYRHATELYLKALSPINKETHDLLKLYGKVKEILKQEFDTIPPKWFENIIIAFNDFDPYGTTFRYGIPLGKDEMFIDLIHIKKVMSWFSESIRRIKQKIYESKIRASSEQCT